MSSMKKLILSVVGLGVVGVGVWAASDFLRDGGAGGPPLPGSTAGPSVATAPISAKPREMKLPDTRPVPPAATVAAAQQPSYLYIKYLPDDSKAADDSDAPRANDFGTPVQFPPARLHVSSKADEPPSVLLFSDDPKEAINKDWAGDRYYFSMAFQQPIGDDRQLDGVDWPFTASSSEKEETGNGIFLHGDQYHLEPVQAIVHFEGVAPHMLVKVAGQFLQYDTANPNAPPKRCAVTGVLAPLVENK